MATLPSDLLSSDILPRLPPRSLLRLKCLNKSFYHEISSKEFTRLHLQRSLLSSNTDHRLFMVFTAMREDGQRYLYLVDSDSPPRYLQLPPPFCDPHSDDRYDKTTVVSSCHGLLCLRASTVASSRWIVLNPCTATVSINISISNPKSVPKSTSSGFGYDALQDDYKLVVVEHYFRAIRAAFRKVQIYSMRTNSWKPIDAASTYVPELSVPNSRPNCVVLNDNLLHWLLIGETSNGIRTSIVCFDLQTEQWNADVALPYNFAASYSNFWIDLGFLNGCLCVSLTMLDHSITWWIMKEYGVQESWTKFSVDVPYRLGYRSVLANAPGPTDEILLVEFLVTHPESFLAYNIRDKTFKELKLSGGPRHLSLESVCLGSLVTGFEDRQTNKRKASQQRMKVDKKLKIDKVNLEPGPPRRFQRSSPILRI